MKKCRAWDKEEQIWLDPEHFYITGEGRPFTCQQSRHNISCRYELMGTDRYIVEEDTGLKDKNVWAGDILKVEIDVYNGIYVCKYRIDLACFVFEGEGEWLLWDDIEEGAKVIGNIHENKDLLEN